MKRMQRRKVNLKETHLVFKGQSLANITREAIDDNAVSLWDLHYLLLYLSYRGLLATEKQDLFSTSINTIKIFVLLTVAKLKLLCLGYEVIQFFDYTS